MRSRSAILAAAYFFIVKPVLDTTDNAINTGSTRASKVIRAGLTTSQDALDTATAAGPAPDPALARPGPARRSRPATQKLVALHPDGAADVRRIAALHRDVLSAAERSGGARGRSRPSRESARSKPDQDSPAGELALEPVEAAEPAAEVVDHVDERRPRGCAGTTGRAVLERAVVAEDDVQDAPAPASGSKPGISSICAAHEVVAERDLALQAAGVGEVDRQRVVVVGLELADVVQERAGDGDVAVDARGRSRPTALTAWATESECSSSPWR